MIAQVPYHFTKVIELKFGQALYLLGSTSQLGSWSIQSSIKMNCIRNNLWIIAVPVPLQKLVEYNFLIAPFDAPPKAISPDTFWLGEPNQTLMIPNHLKDHFLKESNQLTLMSFNIRYESKLDLGLLSWPERAGNVVETILQTFPDLLGTQEVTKNQSKYLLSRLQHLYTYYHRPRMPNSEQIGLFVRKDKFYVVEDGYVWISESRKEGELGYDAKCPRLFAFVVAHRIQWSDMSVSKYPLMVVNTHLDHVGAIAREKGLLLISEVCTEKQKQYDVKDILVTGDFNLPEEDNIFQELKVGGVRMVSMRESLAGEAADRMLTFNGFKPEIEEIMATSTRKYHQKMSIDHIFVSLSSCEPQRFAVLRKKDKIVSDHYPILGTFRWLK